MRGFAKMPKEKRIEIAKKGGSNVPNEKRSFSKNKELASEAGKKGGKNVKIYNRSFYKDRNLAVEAGRKGGRANRKFKVEDET